MMEEREEMESEERRGEADHPGLGGARQLPVLFKHPAVVRQELLEAESHSEDEGEPQQRAEDHRRHHRLALGTQRLTGTHTQSQ